ncbi:MAG: hypothetical protein AAF512_04035 [Pseudomonadota bacterium]
MINNLIMIIVGLVLVILPYAFLYQIAPVGHIMLSESFATPIVMTMGLLILINFFLDRYRAADRKITRRHLFYTFIAISFFLMLLESYYDAQFEQWLVTMMIYNTITIPVFLLLASDKCWAQMLRWYTIDESPWWQQENEALDKWSRRYEPKTQTEKR